MADDPKLTHAGPPLANKGAARPLARSGPGASLAADQGYERRLTGLHTRPDLFGARAVMPRPVEASTEASDQTDPRHGRDDAASEANADPRRDAAGRPAQSIDDTKETPDSDPAAGTGGDRRSDRTSDAPEVAGGTAAPAGASLPAATLLDHPLRIPASISFEDWPGGAEPEHGSRSPDGASAATDQPQPDEPVPPDQSADHPEDRGRTAGASAADAGRAGRLLAWMEGDANLRRLRQDRWPLVVAAASCAALLLAAVVGGVIPLGGSDQSATELALNLDPAAPAEAQQNPEDLAGLAEDEPADIPVAPAGNSYQYDPPARPQPNRSGAGAGDQPDTSQLAALPDSRAPGPLDRDREPIVDFMRIDPDGKAVVAGRAAPGTELIVLDNGEPLGSITADIYGLWTFVSQKPLASGRHEIGLEVKRQHSEAGDPSLVTDNGTARPFDAEAALGPQDPATDETGRQIPRGSDQLAAAPTGTAVESDQTAPEGAAADLGTGARDPAVPQGPQETPESAVADSVVAGSGAPVEPEAGDADRPDAGAASQTPSAPAPKPEPKPESPGQVQTAATDPAAGRYVIQLASFKNPDTAAREQAIVEVRFADLLAGHEVFVQQVDLADQGTFYRVRLGPFTSLADARAACARFQARDRDCLAMAR